MRYRTIHYTSSYLPFLVESSICPSNVRVYAVHLTLICIRELWDNFAAILITSDMLRPSLGSVSHREMYNKRSCRQRDTKHTPTSHAKDTHTTMRSIKLKIFPVPVRLHSGYGELIFVITSPFFAIFKNAVHSLEPGETPSYYAQRS